MSLDSREFSVWVQSVLCIPKVGRKTAWKVFEEFPEAIKEESAFLDFIAEQSIKIPRMKPVTQSDANGYLKLARGIIEKTYKNKGSVLNFRDFPSKLSRSVDPPLLLHCLGDTSIIHERGVAVIGTREPTEFGYDKAEELGVKLANHKQVVTSGLALGCDTGGHIGCLMGNGKTIAVLAHGLDSMYPLENRELAIRILKCGGLLLSEYPFGTKVRGPYFVERDRIQAALSDILFVIETGIKGGTLHTVGFASKNNVPVYALNHPKELHEHPQVLGNRLLLDERKAKPLEPNLAELEKILNSTSEELSESSSKDFQSELF